MALYARRKIRYRGRLVRVYTRHGYPLTVQVIMGKPLDFGRFTAGIDEFFRNRPTDTTRVLKLYMKLAEARGWLD